MLWSRSFLFKKRITSAVIAVNIENATANPTYKGTFVLKSDREAKTKYKIRDKIIEVIIVKLYNKI